MIVTASLKKDINELLVSFRGEGGVGRDTSHEEC